MLKIKYEYTTLTDIIFDGHFVYSLGEDVKHPIAYPLKESVQIALRLLEAYPNFYKADICSRITGEVLATIER